MRAANQRAVGADNRLSARFVEGLARKSACATLQLVSLCLDGNHGLGGNVEGCDARANRVVRRASVHMRHDRLKARQPGSCSGFSGNAVETGRR